LTATCAPPSGERRAVHLRHRRGRHRLRVEAREDRVERTAEARLDHAARVLEGKRRHLVAQGCELLDQLARQQVAAGRGDLADLDEGRAEAMAQRHVRASGRAHEAAAPLAAQPPRLRDPHRERDRARPQELAYADQDAKQVAPAAVHAGSAS
jgi:hypothetical protein